MTSAFCTGHEANKAIYEFKSKRTWEAPAHGRHRHVQCYVDGEPKMPPFMVVEDGMVRIEWGDLMTGKMVMRW